MRETSVRAARAPGTVMIVASRHGTAPAAQPAMRTGRLDPASWQLEASGGLAGRCGPACASFHAMRSETLAETLECAGNGRSAFAPPAEGEQ